MYIQMAPIQLREGIDERTLVEASERFQAAFVNKQHGIVKRILMRGKHGGYADLVFFASKEDADRVAELEATSEHCLEFFKIMQPPDPSLPDMGVLSFEQVKTYEQAGDPVRGRAKSRRAPAGVRGRRPTNAQSSGCT